MDTDRTASNAPGDRNRQVAHYRITAKLGAGAMGEVYLAEDTRLQRQAVLKFLSAKLASEKSARTRFLREARTAAKLNHQHIATIYDVLEAKDYVCIAMEYVAGCTLRDLIVRQLPEPRRALEIVIQICRGLEAAHRGQVVHRDLKPSNIMIDKSGCCKLVDFGLAKVIGDSELTIPGTVMGTANYMSPEQALGQEVDHRSDIFSLGVILCELLTGKRPFERNSLPATIHSIIHDPHPQLEESGPLHCESCQRVIDRLLAKLPAERYQTASELISALRDLSAGLPITETKTRKPQVQSLAVLYLRNLGAPEDEFLSYGITEDLIVDLSRIGTLRVAPMRSVLRFKGSDLELEDIATQLDVSLILDGSIRRSEDSVRASAQLVDVHTGEILWASRWDESLDRIPHIKEALAAGISEAINVDSSVVRATQLGRPEASNAQAYEFYLRGKYAFDHRQSASDIDVALELYRQALELEPVLPAARTGLAEIMLYAGQPEQAATRLLNTLAEARQRHLRVAEANTLRLLASTRTHQSRWDEAAGYAEQSVEISAELGDLAGEAAALGILIEITQRRAKFDKALEYAERVLEINRRLLDQEREADALNRIGTVHLFSGDSARAREFYQEALAIAEKRQDLDLQARCIANLGSTHVYRNEFEEARRLYEQSLDLFRRLGDQSRQATILNNLARIHISTGSYQEALEFYSKAVEIHSDIGDRGAEGLAHNNQAIILTVLDRQAEAEEALEKALKIARDLSYPLIETAALSNLGFLELCRGDFTAAGKTLTKARKVAEHSGLQRELAAAEDHLGDLRFREGKFDQAFEHFEATAAIAGRLGLKQVKLKADAHLAMRSALAGDLDGTIAELERLRLEAATFRDPTYRLNVGRLLGGLLAEQGRDARERERGIATLREMLGVASERGISYEIKWISEALEELSSS
ncbi:MAG: tetratricopeptide repeat protein [bacterium]